MGDKDKCGWGYFTLIANENVVALMMMMMMMMMVTTVMTMMTMITTLLISTVVMWKYLKNSEYSQCIND